VLDGTSFGSVAYRFPRGREAEDRKCSSEPANRGPRVVRARTEFERSGSAEDTAVARPHRLSARRASHRSAFGAPLARMDRARGGATFEAPWRSSWAPGGQIFQLSQEAEARGAFVIWDSRLCGWRGVERTATDDLLGALHEARGGGFEPSYSRDLIPPPFRAHCRSGRARSRVADGGRAPLGRRKKARTRRSESGRRLCRFRPFSENGSSSGIRNSPSPCVLRPRRNGSGKSRQRLGFQLLRTW